MSEKDQQQDHLEHDDNASDASQQHAEPADEAVDHDHHHDDHHDHHHDDHDHADDSHHDDANKSKNRGKHMLVRYGKMGLLGLFRHSEKQIPRSSRFVIVQTERGIELGEIVSIFFHHRGTCDLSPERIEAYCKQSGDGYPLNLRGRFIRFASEQDINEQRHLEQQAKTEWNYCAELITRHELPMHLVDVEHLFGGDRIIYYFMSDGRVDFRQLVKDLAQQYQTRIEMRQVGARDEARIVADFETCGRECCCKNFLKVLQPVNMRMAKLQKATLDPAKISGRCGRLKCCLRYEDEIYTELKRKLPRGNATVLTEKGPGTVIDSQVLTQLVRVRLDNGAVIAVAVDELQDKNYQRPAGETIQDAQQSQDASRSSRSSRSDRSSNDRRRRSDQSPDQQQTEAADDNNADSKAANNDSSDANVDNQQQNNGDNPSKKRRRRKRRKKSPGNNNSDNGNDNNNNNADPSGNAPS